MSVYQRMHLYRYSQRALVILALAYAFVAGLRTLGDLDLGWQLATGRWIVQHRQIPLTDVFSYTAAGTEWIYPVLSQLLLYLGYAIGGYTLLSWAGAAACVGTVALLLRRSSSIGAALAVVSVPLIAGCTVPRAAMFTALLFAAFLSILWQHHRSGNGMLWVLPLLMCLWVNLHLGFVSGLAMWCAYLALELSDIVSVSRRSDALRRLRKAVPWLVATYLATLLNPWGWRVYVALARQQGILQMHSKWVWEWMGVRLTPVALGEALVGRGPNSLLIWLIGVAMAATLCAVLMRRFVPALLLISSIYFVIHAIRTEATFASFVIVIAGTVFADVFDVVPARWARKLFRAVTEHRDAVAVTVVLGMALFVALRTADLVTSHYYLREPKAFSTFGAGNSCWYPEGAAAFVLKERLPRNVFHNFNLGGFVTWKLAPDYPDYIDGRSIPFGGSLLLHNIDLSGQSLDSKEWVKEANVRKINTILSSTDIVGGAGLQELSSYCNAQSWRPVFLDGSGAVFLRVEPETASLIDRLQIDCKTVQFKAPTTTLDKAQQFRYLVNVAATLIVLDRNVEALQRLDEAERIFSENPAFHYVKGIALGNLGFSGDSERELLASVELGSTDDAPPALARLYDQQGRYAEEAQVLSQAADLADMPHMLYLMLGNVHLTLGHPDLALTAFNEAERWDPYTGDAYSLGTGFRSQLDAGKERAMQMARGLLPAKS